VLITKIEKSFYRLDSVFRIRIILLFVIARREATKQSPW
jgi:hypothetical protein